MNDLPDSWYPTHWRCQSHGATGRLDDDSYDEHVRDEHDGVEFSTMIFREEA